MRRKMLSVFSLVGAAIVFGGAIAFACTNLATLNTDQAAGGAGDTVALTGSSFGPNGEVEIHWNGVDGPVLATIPTDASGSLTLSSVTIPEANPGFYTLVATQATEEGGTQFGTPARASFQVLGPAGDALVAQASPGDVLDVAVPAASASTGLIVLTAVLGVLGLGLFGAGIGSFMRQSRSEVPARVPTGTDS